MASGLERGYATASTDTGHEGGSASFALGHPEKVIDFGWRAVHEMTVTAKQVIAAFYGSGPEYSYWYGCSAGGRQAMMEAQRFPGDYDGIIAGAPGNDWTGRAAGSLRIANYLGAHEDAGLSAAKVELVRMAVLEACDAADGVIDKVVGDPERCDFDPAVLQCSGADNGSCLTAAQVNTVKMLYSSPENPKTGRAITGVLPGSESNWTDLGWTRSARASGLDQYRYLVYGDPEWTVDRFDFGTDIVRAEETDGGTLNALDPDLRPFFDRGGKLLANRLVIRLQPEEYVRLMVMAKEPGMDRDGVSLREVPLDLSLTQAFSKARRRIAYERLLLALIDGDPTLFVRRDEVEAQWKWIDAIRAVWSKEAIAPKSYSAGSWGPSASVALTERDGVSWHE